MTRPARVSPDRILAAAALEFAERGFGGARVDRIARRARVNKAMLYYHFKNKQGLYRALLGQMFALAGGRLQEIAQRQGPPERKLDDLIAAFAQLIVEHASLPAIMLREVAEGGVHLDRQTLAALANIPRAVATIVREGVESGVFRPVNPLFAHFSLLAPIVFFHAGAPIRRELAHLNLMKAPTNSTAAFVRHMQDATRRALAHDGARVGSVS